jgi:hypothetical protein
MYVIKAFDNYFIRDDGDKLSETYNLYNATKFKTKEEAEDVCASCNISEYFKIIPFSSAKIKYDKWAEEGMVRRKINKIDRKISRKYEGGGLKEVLDFRVQHIKNENLIAYSDYKTWPQLYGVSKYLNNVSSYTDGRLTVEIQIKKDGVFKDFYEEIIVCIPFITHIENNYYVLPIVDHELSKFESRYLCIHKDLKHGLIRNSRKVLIHEEDKLENCFEYIKKYFWY